MKPSDTVRIQSRAINCVPDGQRADHREHTHPLKQSHFCQVFDGPSQDQGLWDYLGNEVGSYESALSRHETNDILYRTMAGRLADHAILLRDARRSRTLGRRLGTYGRRQLFVDVGSAVANREMPARTTAEISSAFSDIQLVAVDLPRAVEKLRLTANRHPQQTLLGRQNLNVIPGEARDSLRSLLDRGGVRIGALHRTKLDRDDLVIVRAANSVDIYCDRPTNRNFLDQIGEDFAKNPALILFNRTILTKDQGTKHWRFIGTTSARGFNHRTRELVPYGPGHPPAYVLRARA